MEPFRWRCALFLGLVSYAASLAGLVFDTFVPVLLQAGHPLWHNTTDLQAPPVGFALAPSLAFFIMTWDKPTVCPSNNSANMLSYQELPTSIQLWRG